MRWVILHRVVADLLEFFHPQPHLFQLITYDDLSVALLILPSFVQAKLFLDIDDP